MSRLREIKLLNGGTPLLVAVALFWQVAAMAADQVLIESAKREGSVVWYTTQIVQQLVAPLSSTFEKMYGVKVTFVRANATDVVLRVINEAAAGQVRCDVFDGITTVASLERQGLVQSWLPESAQHLPKHFADPRGYWVATNLYVTFPAVNTDLVRADDEPKSWDDLLDPKWSGKMAISSSNSPAGAPGLVGLVLATMGEEKGTAFLRRLSEQKIASIPVAARQVLDQVLAGEYAMGLNMQVHHVSASASQGAPLKWVPLSPALVTLSTVSIARNPPHPNAAKLFLEFLISEEGQALYRDADYVPAHPGVKVRDARMVPDGKNFSSVFFSPSELDVSTPKWNMIYRDLFR